MLPSSRFRRSASVGVVLAAVCSLGVLRTGSAEAQSRVEVTPYFATYFPLVHYYESNQISTNLGTREKQTIGPTIGAKLGVGIGPQLSLVGDLKFVSTGTLVSSDLLDEQNAPSPVVSGGGTLLIVSGGLEYRPRRSNVLVGAGIGWMSRGGDVWDEDRYLDGRTFDTGNFTTTVSVGSRAQLTPRFPIFVGLEALAYSVEKVTVESTDPDFEQSVKKFQVDILLKLGVPIGGR
jgi:hypothetical protein